MIPFNKPYLTGKEVHYLYQAVYSGHISGNGIYTKKCQQFFEEKWGFKKCLMTTSCTDALEMCALLLDIKIGDEVIIPSYTFVSTALAFVRQNAKIVFADSRLDRPGIDEDHIEELITSKTKVIVVVHYAGVACNMDKITALAVKYNLFLVEDAAQAIDSYYNGKPLGSFGDLATFSFHETKNVQCGEGGMLIVNNEKFIKRAEIIWEKGTNRAEFFRGEINKYGWVDIGSSFLPAEIISAFLYAQLENLENIQKKRIEIWNWYFNHINNLYPDFRFAKPIIPDYATNNGHMFYLIFDSYTERTEFINFNKGKGVVPVFHYLSLHKSKYFNPFHDKRELLNSDKFENTLVRMPFYYELNFEDIINSLI